MTTEKAVSFNRNGAMQYAEEHSYQLPKKAHKDEQLLAKVIEECILEDVKEIPEKDRFDCGDCHKVVQEADDWCWFCGADISEVLDEPSASVEADAKTEQQAETASASTPAKVENKATLAKPGKQEKLVLVDDKTTKPKKQEGSERNLAKFVSVILEENGRSGYSAWLIGRSLIEIQTSKSYAEKYETLEDCVNKELAFSWRTAGEYMRIFKSFKEKDAKLQGLGFIKLLTIAGAPENARQKLLKFATPVNAGGKGMTGEDLKQAVRDACDKAGGGQRPGRKVKDKVESWVKALKKEPLEITIKDGGGSKDVGSGHEVKVTVLKTKVRVWVEKVEA